MWANSAQIAFAASTAAVKTGIWGRGTGKTTEIGIEVRQKAAYFPRAKYFLSSSTYNQLLTSSLPPMIDFWNRCGMIEYDRATKTGHFVVGIAPPPHFIKPYKEPKSYKYCITFYNGFCLELKSMDRPDSGRGGNYDGGFVDEAALVKKEHLQKVLIPSVRGNDDRFGRNPLTAPYHGQIALYSSMPWLATGQYILGYEQMAAEDPDTFYYQEATAEVNLKALGPGWLEKMRKLLDPWIFRLEIMNERLTKAESCFYHAFAENRHVYTPAITYKDAPTGRGIITDRVLDYSPDQIIEASFDFGGWFNCALLFQSKLSKSGPGTERMIDSFFAKEGSSVEDVVNLICDRYESHSLKVVRIYGEPRGNDRSGHGTTLYEKAVQAFTRHGWTAELMVYQTQAHAHDVRYKFINDVLTETVNVPRLRINRDTCKNVIIALQLTGVTHDLKKDKSNERKREFPQENAPHFTDALDYFYMQKHFKPFTGHGGEVF